MAVGIRSWTTMLGVWATAAVSRSAPSEQAAPFGLRQQEQQHQHRRQQTKPPPASLLLDFTNPTNGSRVEGPNVKLHYKIFSTNADGIVDHELTRNEVRALAETSKVCFKLHGFNDPPEICAPLRVSPLTIRDALPAKWHTVTGLIKDAKTGQSLGVSDGGVSVFNNLNGYGVLDMCGESACLDSSDLRAAYFDYVYRHPNWNANWNAKVKTGTQPMTPSTLSIRAALAGVLSAFNIKSILDAPCGDLTWMPLVPGINNVRYTGVDIVDLAVKNNRKQFQLEGRADLAENAVAAAAAAGDAGGEDVEGVLAEQQIAEVGERGRGLKDPVFYTADLVEGVPASRDGKPFDLVFVRDLMVHLPARHNLRVIKNIQASGARFLMASTYVHADENSASESFVPPVGHNINLSLPPYCLPEPLAVFADESTARRDLRMGLWDLHQDSPLALSGSCSPMSATV